MKIGQADLAELKRLEAQLLEQNPLEGFHACPGECPDRDPTCKPRQKQHEFMLDPAEVVATNAGNRFGKTTAMVVWAIIQHCPEQHLPDRLKVFKRERGPNAQGAVRGRYLCPTEQLLNDTILPTFKQWMPTFLLKNGSWKDAYRAQHNELFFEDGGKLVFFTYKQDANALAAASLDYVLWDEPPPVEHWRESGRIRTLDRMGCHRFGMTPVNMVGGGIGWIKREIWDRAKPDHPEYDPDIKVHRGSIWDNPELNPEQIEKVLRSYPADERQAREHGDFIHFGGMIYPGGFERIKRPEPRPDEIKNMDVVVGIDPGLKNAAFVWVAFDNDNRALVFDELLLREATPKDYVEAIRFVNSRWGIKSPSYVIDPSARNRSLVNADSVESLLMTHGIYCSHGNNQVQAGVQQARDRINQKGLFIAETCTGLRGEADEYRMEDRPDGEFKAVKENDHRLDALRYALMERLWFQSPEVEDSKRLHDLYGDPTWEPAFDPYTMAGTPEHGPMGPWS